MPYSHRYRLLGDPIGGIVDGVDIGLFPRNQEYTYSWRSRVSRDDLSDHLIGGNFGVVSPRTTGNLSDIIADRRRWADELNQVASGSNQTSTAGTKAISKTDTGHTFRTLKLNVLQAMRYKAWRSDGIGLSDFDAFFPHRPFVPNGWEISPTQMDPVLPASFPAGLSSPANATQQAKLNQAFRNMIPNAPEAQIGETIVSLLRGEFPRVIGNFSRLLQRGRISLSDVTRYTGGEYLNITFGWTPLIRDIQNIINVFTTLDHLIYGTSYRRDRTIRYPSQFVRSNGSNQLWGSFPSNPKGSRGVGLPGAIATTSELQYSLSYDTRISARMGALARPGLGANDFISKAEELNNRLGVWYPSLVWDLTPYSWLIDWFFHLGSAIENAYAFSSSGAYPLDYAWATSVQRVTTSFTVGTRRMSGVLPNGVRYDYSCLGSSLVQSVAKRRFSATPFGFGVDLTGLSGSQLAILVALGLAKSP